MFLFFVLSGTAMCLGIHPSSRGRRSGLVAHSGVALSSLVVSSSPACSCSGLVCPLLKQRICRLLSPLTNTLRPASACCLLDDRLDALSVVVLAAPCTMTLRPPPPYSASSRRLTPFLRPPLPTHRAFFAPHALLLVRRTHLLASCRQGALSARLPARRCAVAPFAGFSSPLVSEKGRVLARGICSGLDEQTCCTKPTIPSRSCLRSSRIRGPLKISATSRP